MRDLVTHIDPEVSIAPQANGGSAITGSAVDLRGYDSCAIHIIAGTVTSGGGFEYTVQESDDNASWSDVSDDDLQGTNDQEIDEGVTELGYTGYKRYVRVNTNDGGSASVAALVQLGNKHVKQAKF